jgi:hypothetical protein
MSDPVNMYGMVEDKQALGDLLPKHNKVRRNTIMKKRFFLAAMLSICIMLFVSVSAVNAAVGWYDDCIVGGVGAANDGLGLIYLSGGTPAIPAKWYRVGISVTTANQMMATGMTALSTGGTVGVAVDPNVGTNPVIQTIIVNKAP